MTSFWNGIAWLFEQMFKVLPAVGKNIDWIFIGLLAVGSVYWMMYEYKVERGGKNYMADKKKP